MLTILTYRKKLFAALTLFFLLAPILSVIPTVVAPSSLYVEVAVEDNRALQTSNYNITLNTVYAEEIAFLEFVFPDGFDVTAAELVDISGFGSGVLENIGLTALFYAVDNPRLVPGGVTVLLQISGIKNIAACGQYNITVLTIGDSFNIMDNVQSDNFTINPLLTIDPSFGGARTNVYITGQYFRPNETVTLYFNNTAIETLTTNASGAFTTLYTVNVDGSSSIVDCYFNSTDTDGFFADANFPINPIFFSVSPRRGAQLVTVSTTGSNFSPNSLVTIVWDKGTSNQVTLNTTTTNATGGFSNVTFTVPNGSYGYHNVTATDGDGHTIIVTYRILMPSLVINGADWTGVKGFNFTLTGSYFTPNSVISLLWNNLSANITLGSVTALADGTFTTTLTVPSTAVTGFNIIYAVASDNKSSSDV
ncbi:MAG TPA: hypothetical protein VLH35_00835, partial [Candidatus Acidoferrales bacterium]|nr:hypothetical protein [Candidatus Acidoferrales bacterium]